MNETLLKFRGGICFMRKSIARALCFVLVTILLLPTAVVGRDGFILTDPVENTYTGRSQMERLIQQLQFTDLPENESARDAIIRGFALEIFRPVSNQFRPDAPIMWEDGVIYALRIAGLSERARQLGQDTAGENPLGLPLDDVWQRGYLQLAVDIGIITPAEFVSATAGALMEVFEEALEELEGDDPPPSGADDEEEEIPLPFVPTPRNPYATREELASWLVGAMEYTESDIFEGTGGGFAIYSYTDWSSISSPRVDAIEKLLTHGVMRGQTPTVFGPSSTVSRLEMAQIIRNLDTFLHELLELTRVTGTVGNVIYEQFHETASHQAWRHVYIRRADGRVDMLTATHSISPSPQALGMDAVVLRNGIVTGLGGLQIGDLVEYLVHEESGEVWYVHVIGQSTPDVVRLRLQRIDMEQGTMTFSDVNEHIFRFPMSYGLFGTLPDGRDFIRFYNDLRPADYLPRGVYYDLTLMNNVIVGIEFVGTAVVAPETRGIVIDNNPLFGSLTIIDQNRIQRTFNYNPGQLRAQRRVFFDMRDVIGGVHEMFPTQNHRYVDISEIQPGDIVSFATADDDPFRIISISASENTTTRYGRIREVRDQGGFFDMLMEFDNNQTAWFTFVDNVLVLDRGRPVHPNNIQVGDWARLVVNQAVIAPGVMLESVREIAIDGGGHHISSVVIGYLSGFNHSQNQITLQHARTLTPAGWSEHRQLANFNIGGANVRYYLNGSPITLAHMNRYLQRTDATVYMALENNFAGERVVMVSVRTGRDELLRGDVVLASNNNEFHMFEIPGAIRTDPSTIVTRNGRLVDHSHIFGADWARVSLNGGNLAAIVDIGPPPVTSGVQIVRGRIAQIFPFQSFRVETMSLFDGFRWHFTPIPREFTIDHNTLFFDEGGWVSSIDEFIGWGENSRINDVFNIVVEGGRATRVIAAPFTQPIPSIPGGSGHLTIRGTIYNINGNTVHLREVSVYNASNAQWSRISNVNATAVVTVQGNAIVVDRNEIIPADRLQVGQQILVLNDIDRTEHDIEPGMTLDAYMVFVES